MCVCASGVHTANEWMDVCVRERERERERCRCLCVHDLGVQYHIRHEQLMCDILSHEGSFSYFLS